MKDWLGREFAEKTFPNIFDRLKYVAEARHINLDDAAYDANEYLKELIQLACFEGIKKDLEKLKSGPVWIEHKPMHSVYDGSQFACALQVNEENNSFEWEIYTIQIHCDDYSFQIYSLNEGESCEIMSALDWEDFEFVYPLNKDARKSIHDFWYENDKTK